MRRCLRLVRRFLYQQVSAKRLPLNPPVRALHSADWNTVSAAISQARWTYCGLSIFEGRPLLLGGISQRAVLRRDPAPRNRRGAAGGVAEIISYECDHPPDSPPHRGGDAPPPKRQGCSGAQVAKGWWPNPGRRSSYLRRLQALTAAIFRINSSCSGRFSAPMVKASRSPSESANLSASSARERMSPWPR